MKLTAPKQVTWWIALVVAVVGLLGQFGVLPLAGFGFWLVLIAYALMAVATLITGL